MIAGVSILTLFVSIFRELLTVYFLGVGHELDMFKLATAVPNLIIFTIIPGVGLWFSGYFQKEGIGKVSVKTNTFYASLFICAALFSIIYFSAELLTLALAPGISGASKESITEMIKGSAVLILFSSFFVIPKADGINGVKQAAASTQLMIVHLSWLSLMTFMWFSGVRGSTLPYLSLLLSFSSVAFLYCCFSMKKVDWNCASVKVVKALISAVVLVSVFRVVNVFPRFIDRAMASYIEGAVGILEVGFSVVNGIATVIISYLTFVYFAGFYKDVQKNNINKLRSKFILGLKIGIGATGLLSLICFLVLLMVDKYLEPFPWMGTVVFLLVAVPGIVVFLSCASVYMRMQKTYFLIWASFLKVCVKILLLAILLFFEFDTMTAIIFSFILAELFAALFLVLNISFDPIEAL